MYLPKVEALGPFASATTRAGTSFQMIRHKTEVHTSTLRMAITMTTSRLMVRRERVEDWPLFEGLTLPPDLAALSVENNRLPNQSIDRAVAEAADVLRSSLAAARRSGEFKYWLVASSVPVRAANKVAAYNAKREKVWGVLERRGIEIPTGSRREWEASLSDDTFVLMGSVELDPGGLALALTATRRADAVCIAAAPSSVDPMASIFPRYAQSLGDASTLLVTSVQLAANWAFVARAFGEFDDVSVGVEVFAREVFLDVLLPSVIAAAGDHPSFTV